MGKLFILLAVGFLLMSCGGDDEDTAKGMTCADAETNLVGTGCGNTGNGTLSENILECLKLKGTIHTEAPACDDDFQRYLDCYGTVKQGQCSSCIALFEKLFTCS